jgi:hypothetical protein
MRHLHPNFRHVYAMQKTKYNNNWIIVHPHHSHTSIELEPVSLFPTARSYVNTLPDPEDHNATIITVRAKIDQYQHNRHISTLSCVDVIKSILGIRDAMGTPCALPRINSTRTLSGANMANTFKTGASAAKRQAKQQRAAMEAQRKKDQLRAREAEDDVARRRAAATSGGFRRTLLGGGAEAASTGAQGGLSNTLGG